MFRMAFVKLGPGLELVSFVGMMLHCTFFLFMNLRIKRILPDLFMTPICRHAGLATHYLASDMIPALRDYLGELKTTGNRLERALLAVGACAGDPGTQLPSRTLFLSSLCFRFEIPTPELCPQVVQSLGCAHPTRLMSS